MIDLRICNEYRVAIDATVCVSLKARTEEAAVATAKELASQFADGLSIRLGNEAYGALLYLDHTTEPDIRAETAVYERFNVDPLKLQASAEEVYSALVRLLETTSQDGDLEAATARAVDVLRKVSKPNT